MKADYDVITAKSMITRNGGKLEGKAILFEFPGIKVLGAIDYLISKGFSWNRNTQPKKNQFAPPKKTGPTLENILRLGAIAAMLRRKE